MRELVCDLLLSQGLFLSFLPFEMWHTVKAKQKASTKYSTKNQSSSSGQSAGNDLLKPPPQGSAKTLARKLRAASLVFRTSCSTSSSSSFVANSAGGRRKRHGGAGTNAEDEDMVGLVRRVLLPSVRDRLWRFLCAAGTSGGGRGETPLGKDKEEKETVKGKIRENEEGGETVLHASTANINEGMAEQELDGELTRSSPSTLPLSQRKPVITVLLYGLGIGAFHPDESKASFLQMAAFVALQRECLEVIDTWMKNASPPTQEARLRTFFFDPCTTALHWDCCGLLDIEVEQQNRMGWYCASVPQEPRSDDIPVGDRTLLIVYAPHCPWPLLHNLFAANWPVAGKPATTTNARSLEEHAEEKSGYFMLHDLHVIGNDPREAPLDGSVVVSTKKKSKGKLLVFHPEFVSLLKIAPPLVLTDLHVGDNMNVEHSGTRNGKQDCTDVAVKTNASHIDDMRASSCEEEALASGSTFGANVSTDDLFQAFYGTASYCLREDQPKEKLLTQLRQISSKPPVRITSSSELR